VANKLRQALTGTFLMMFSLSLLAGDPMRPPGWGNKDAPQIKEEPATEFTLQQIRFRGAKGSAVINNQLVYTGDTVAGAKVIAIHPDRVTVKVRQKVIELSLLNSMRH